MFLNVCKQTIHISHVHIFQNVKVVLMWNLPTSYFRSSHPDVFLGKGVLKLCSKFTGEHPCRSAISVKMQSNWCSLVHLLLIFRTTFLRNTSGWLLLNIFYYVILYLIIYITLPAINQSSLISSTYYDWGIFLGRKIALSVAVTPVTCLY